MKRDLVIAASLSAFLSIILPLQSYLANASLFVFTPGRLALEMAILFAALTLGAWIVLIAFGRFLGGTLQAILTAALACVYLESGVLSAGLPEVNGGFMPELAVRSRAAIDIAIWAMIAVGMVATVKWTRRHLHWVALALLALSACSLFDVRREKVAEAAHGSGFESQLDIIGNFRYSPKRNVLVFILDSMTGGMSYDFVAGDPEMREKFAGFAAYTNNVGMHDCTKFGLPGLMTGRYFEPGVSSAADYPMSIFGRESFITAYADRGASVYFSPDLLPYGFTNGEISKRTAPSGRQKHGWAAMLLRSREVPYLSLFDVAVFRLVPYVAKAPFLYSKIRHDPMMGRDSSAFWYEHVMYPILAKAGTSASPCTLGVFHSRGAHPPLVFDPEGRPYPEPQLRPDMGAELVATPLRHLGRLLDVLRQRGLYDSAFIAVVADHGTNLARCARGHEPSESAILWVKPENSRAPFAADALPTGYANVAALMRLVAVRSPDIAEIGQTLRSSARLYRYQRGDGFAEHLIGPHGELLKQWDE